MLKYNYRTTPAGARSNTFQASCSVYFHGYAITRGYNVMTLSYKQLIKRFIALVL